jgi:hypothetical protein
MAPKLLQSVTAVSNRLVRIFSILGLAVRNRRHVRPQRAYAEGVVESLASVIATLVGTKTAHA